MAGKRKTVMANRKHLHCLHLGLCQSRRTCAAPLWVSETGRSVKQGCARVRTWTCMVSRRLRMGAMGLPRFVPSGMPAPWFVMEQR